MSLFDRGGVCSIWDNPDEGVSPWRSGPATCIRRDVRTSEAAH